MCYAYMVLYNRWLEHIALVTLTGNQGSGTVKVNGKAYTLKQQIHLFASTDSVMHEINL